ASGEIANWAAVQGRTWSVDQVFLKGQCNSLRTAADFERGEDAAHVELDRGAAHDQAIGNLRVAQPLDHQPQYLVLPRCEVITDLGPARRGVDQRLRRLGRERRAAPVSRTDGPGKLVGRDVLQQ